MGLNELLQNLEADKEFEAKYQALTSLDAWLVQAKEDGYCITKEELETVLQNAKNGELSDEEMTNAAGGTSIGIPTGRPLPFLMGGDKPKMRTLPYLSGGKEPNIHTVPYKAGNDKPDVFLV